MCYYQHLIQKLTRPTNYIHPVKTTFHPPTVLSRSLNNAAKLWNCYKQASRQLVQLQQPGTLHHHRVTRLVTQHEATLLPMYNVHCAISHTNCFIATNSFSGQFSNAWNMCVFKLCYNCLQTFTRRHVCSQQACRQCNKRHHTLLHGATYRQSADDNQPTTSRSASNKGTSPTEAM